MPILSGDVSRHHEFVATSTLGEKDRVSPHEYFLFRAASLSHRGCGKRGRNWGAGHYEREDQEDGDLFHDHECGRFFDPGWRLSEVGTQNYIRRMGSVPAGAVFRIWTKDMK